ncbi:hypothetical protein [Streptomyces stelliscabiei]|uniref:hypothetical protein n=1 Tax=Streptomyces stelliscabiei TaxID=146820 RepID=UPI0029BB17FE|nr:hypothetical protein [Streptomyces stelliscabiei]MDX2639927.1 hypothetical protein [Streptomyces stelliscabiei]MDX2662841.1 hypothetical protein [Streptomyces stelliscabiei]MDX2714507.1 hypothetical protein [Streptomyces stelliscabiei]MDX2792244.1 hypothetical protein [Streptomyces stelliscabiei]
MNQRSIPTVWQLTRGQRDAENCVWCGRLLDDSAVRVGLAVGYWGAHNRSVGVYSCPDCAKL